MISHGKPNITPPCVLKVGITPLALSFTETVPPVFTSAESILGIVYHDSVNIVHRYIVKNRFMCHGSILFSTKPLNKKPKMNRFTVLESDLTQH